MLQILDVFFTMVHLIIIVFNLIGWIWAKTRKLHFYSIILTAGSWFILGIWYGFGYCPVTDWQWQVKEKLGEKDLPNSFIKYFADKISGADINPSLIDKVTVISFFLAALLSVYVNFKKKRTVIAR